MKFHAFRINYNDVILPIRNILDGINSISIERRYNNFIPGLRLETLTHNNNGYSICTFAIERYNSPGVAKPTSATTDITLTDDEFISEETSVLICHTRNIIIIQFNNHGPRASAIAEYLSAHAVNIGTISTHFNFSPILDTKTAEEIIRNNNIQKVSMKIALNETTLSTLADGLPLGENNIPNNTKEIEIKVSAKSNYLGPISNMTRFLRGEDCKKFVITGRDKDTNEKSVFNLLKGKLEFDKDITRNRVTKRFNRSDINQGLTEAYNQFIDDSVI